MIKVVGTNKYFGENHAIKDISADFERGIVNLIIGQSGSGKTVLLKSILGLHELDEGHILFDDRNFTLMNNKKRKKVQQEIGMVFQGGALFDSLDVDGNVGFPLDMFANFTPKERQERIDFCLDVVNLHNVQHLYPAELSGGMRKRVAIARAISMNPKYLLCDEPNSGLDPKTSLVIDKLIKSITKDFNITTIVNTHDMNTVLEMGDNVLFIYQGAKWWQGSNKEIMQTDNPELNDFTSASKIF